MFFTSQRSIYAMLNSYGDTKAIINIAVVTLRFSGRRVLLSHSSGGV